MAATSRAVTGVLVGGGGSQVAPARSALSQALCIARHCGRAHVACYCESPSRSRDCGMSHARCVWDDTRALLHGCMCVAPFTRRCQVSFFPHVCVIYVSAPP